METTLAGAQGARTPFRLLPEPDGTISVYYTNCPCGRPVPERLWHATFRMVPSSINVVKPRVAKDVAAAAAAAAFKERSHKTDDGVLAVQMFAAAP